MKILTGFSMRQLLNGVNGLEGNTGLIKTRRKPLGQAESIAIPISGSKQIKSRGDLRF